MPLDPAAVDLAGTSAVVTGAAMGIGEAIALTLAAFGADVAVCDREGDALAAVAERIGALGRRVVTGVLDVRDQAAVTNFCNEVAREFGRIDTVVNNAGGGFAAGFLDVSAKGQAALVDENFSSVTHVVRACAPYFPPPPAGASIINITSVEAHRAGPGYAVYSAMKAAVVSLTKSLALEFGHLGVRVNCIAPDLIPTPGVGHGEMLAALPWPGSPDDVAGAAVFLAGPLSRFVTGTTIHVDGGSWASGGWKRLADGTFRP